MHKKCLHFVNSLRLRLTLIIIIDIHIVKFHFISFQFHMKNVYFRFIRGKEKQSYFEDTR